MLFNRSALFACASLVAAAGLAGCHPAKIGQGKNGDDRAVTVSARLDCPESEGDLKRADMAPDGRSCRYTDSDGREAQLTLVDLAGRSAQDVLADREAQLKALVPAAVASSDATAGNETEDADDDGDHKGDHTRIDLPGIHIEADGKDGAKIRAFGQTIDAHGKEAVVHGAWNGKQAVVNAHDGGAEIRAGWVGEHSLDSNYIVAADTPGPSGVRAAGYIARGPTTGPLVLGVETSKVDGDRHDRDEHYRDLRRLVDRNVHKG